MRTEPLEVQTHSFIRDIHISEKLKNFRAAKRKDQFILSKALVMSGLRQKVPFLRFELSF